MESDLCLRCACLRCARLRFPCSSCVYLLYVPLLASQGLGGKSGPRYVANGKVTYRTLHKVGVQEGRGGIGLASTRQKTNHRKENLRRRTDPGLDRETYAAGVAQRR